MRLSDPEWQFLVNAGKLKRCDSCTGRGYLNHANGSGTWKRECPDCHGDGYVIPPFQFNHF